MGREATLQPDVIDDGKNFIKMKRWAGRSMQHVCAGGRQSEAGQAQNSCTPEAAGAEWPRLFHNAVETYWEADACEWLRRLCPNWRTA